MPDRHNHPVFARSDRFVDDYAAAYPIGATLAGLPGHDHEWGDHGPDGLMRREELLRATRRDVAALPAPDDHWSRLATRVLLEFLDEELTGAEAGDWHRDIAHIGSTVPTMRDALVTQDTDTPEGLAAVVARLETFDAALVGWRRTLDVGRDRGLVAARRQVESVARQLRAGVADRGAYTALVGALAAGHPDLAGRLDVALGRVRRASHETAGWLEQVYLPDAADEDAVGRDRYVRHARRQLGTDLDPEEATAWAWELVRTLRTRADATARDLVPGMALPEVVERLRTDPAFAAPNPAAFRDQMQERQEAALGTLDGHHFDVPALVREVRVRLAAPGAPLGAWYVGPAEDAGRPGTIWWSLGDRATVPLYEEVSTAHHEGVPGHHLQVGVQTGLADRLSRVHRHLVWKPGTGEGWALYAEQLMDELGFLERPEYVLGYLTSSLLRAVRVVVDVGLHVGVPIPPDAPFHPGGRFDHEVAVRALQELAFVDRAYAESEVTRYLGLPAQAISYAIGQRAIVRLRDERRAHDGAGFDLRTFHADVLHSGAVGLDHLRELVLR